MSVTRRLWEKPTPVGPLPSLALPGVLGDEGAEAAWRQWLRPYLESPLPVDDRVALLCAALERPEGPSPVHATGLALIGQGEDLVDLASAWRRMGHSDGGRALLESTVRLGCGHAVPPHRLAAAHRHLGARVAPWRDVLALASWSETLQRSLGPRLHPTADPRLGRWLERLVTARGALEEAVPALATEDLGPELY